MDKLKSNALIVFLKYPQAGLVKTRLAKDIGPKSAAALYKDMTELILKNTKSSAYRRFLFYTPEDKRCEISKWLGEDSNLFLQEGDDLGQRLANAFNAVFNRGVRKVVAIGTDSPFVNREIIQQAFSQLGKSQCVIGPCSDGGYYLIGFRSVNNKIFEGIEWGSARVLEQTKQNLKNLELSFTCLKEGFDVDTGDDLKRFWEIKKVKLTLDK